jgi:hypothetical protein
MLGMRTVLITSIATVAAAFSATAASGAPATPAAHCGGGVGPTKYSTTETIKGTMVVVNCGPATAKLRYKGKTYTFKQGTCFHYLGAFKLNLGSSLLVPIKAGGGYSNMTINAVPNGQAEIGAVVGRISIYIAAKFSGVAVKGTFSSTTNGEPATGSWNCGGPIQKN